MKQGDRVDVSRLFNRRAYGTVKSIDTPTAMVTVELDEDQPECRERTIQVSASYVTEADVEVGG